MGPLPRVALTPFEALNRFDRDGNYLLKGYGDNQSAFDGRESEMKKGYKVIDIDTHVNPSYDTLVKYVEPSFRSRLDELKPYIRTVGDYNSLSLASIPFDRFPGEVPRDEGHPSHNRRPRCLRRASHQGFEPSPG